MGENGLRRMLALNNLYRLRFEPTPEVLAFQVLPRRVQRREYVIPSSVLCYFRELDDDNFFQLHNYHQRTSRFYFCRRRLPQGTNLPAGWIATQGPTVIENINNENVYNNGVFFGEYTRYQRTNTNLTVMEYRLIPQQPANEIAIYEILSR